MNRGRDRAVSPNPMAKSPQSSCSPAFVSTTNSNPYSPTSRGSDGSSDGRSPNNGDVYRALSQVGTVKGIYKSGLSGKTGGFGSRSPRGLGSSTCGGVSGSVRHKQQQPVDHRTVSSPGRLSSTRSSSPSTTSRFNASPGRYSSSPGRYSTNGRYTSPRATSASGNSGRLTTTNPGRRSSSPGGSYHSGPQPQLSMTSAFPVGFANPLCLRQPADLQTLLKQLTTYHLLVKQKNARDIRVEEKNLLASWQLTYDAEAEVDTIRTKEAIVKEVIKIHQQIDVVQTMVHKANNYIAPVFECLSSFVTDTSASKDIAPSPKVKSSQGGANNGDQLFPESAFKIDQEYAHKICTLQMLVASLKSAVACRCSQSAVVPSTAAEDNGDDELVCTDPNPPASPSQIQDLLPLQLNIASTTSSPLMSPSRALSSPKGAVSPTSQQRITDAIEAVRLQLRKSNSMPAGSNYGDKDADNEGTARARSEIDRARELLHRRAAEHQHNPADESARFNSSSEHGVARGPSEIELIREQMQKRALQGHSPPRGHASGDEQEDCISEQLPSSRPNSIELARIKLHKIASEGQYFTDREGVSTLERRPSGINPELEKVRGALNPLVLPSPTGGVHVDDAPAYDMLGEATLSTPSQMPPPSPGKHVRDFVQSFERTVSTLQSQSQKERVGSTTHSRANSTESARSFFEAAKSSEADNDFDMRGPPQEHSTTAVDAMMSNIASNIFPTEAVVVSNIEVVSNTAPSGAGSKESSCSDECSSRAEEQSSPLISELDQIEEKLYESSNCGHNEDDTRSHKRFALDSAVGLLEKLVEGEEVEENKLPVDSFGLHQDNSSNVGSVNVSNDIENNSATLGAGGGHPLHSLDDGDGNEVIPQNCSNVGDVIVPSDSDIVENNSYRFQDAEEEVNVQNTFSDQSDSDSRVSYAQAPASRSSNNWVLSEASVTPLGRRSDSGFFDIVDDVDGVDSDDDNAAKKTNGDDDGSSDENNNDNRFALNADEDEWSAMSPDGPPSPSSFGATNNMSSRSPIPPSSPKVGMLRRLMSVRQNSKQLKEEEWTSEKQRTPSLLTPRRGWNIVRNAVIGRGELNRRFAIIKADPDTPPFPALSVDHIPIVEKKQGSRWKMIKRAMSFKATSSSQKNSKEERGLTVGDFSDGISAAVADGNDGDDSSFKQHGGWGMMKRVVSFKQPSLSSGKNKNSLALDIDEYENEKAESFKKDKDTEESTGVDPKQKSGWGSIKRAMSFKSSSGSQRGADKFTLDVDDPMRVETGAGAGVWASPSNIIDTKDDDASKKKGGWGSIKRAMSFRSPSDSQKGADKFALGPDTPRSTADNDESLSMKAVLAAERNNHEEGAAAAAATAVSGKKKGGGWGMLKRAISFKAPSGQSKLKSEHHEDIVSEHDSPQVDISSAEVDSMRQTYSNSTSQAGDASESLRHAALNSKLEAPKAKIPTGASLSPSSVRSKPAAPAAAAAAVAAPSSPKLSGAAASRWAMLKQAVSAKPNSVSGGIAADHWLPAKAAIPPRASNVKNNSAPAATGASNSNSAASVENISSTVSSIARGGSSSSEADSYNLNSLRSRHSGQSGRSSNTR